MNLLSVTLSKGFIEVHEMTLALQCLTNVYSKPVRSQKKPLCFVLCSLNEGMLSTSDKTAAIAVSTPGPPLFTVYFRPDSFSSMVVIGHAKLSPP